MTYWPYDSLGWWAYAVHCVSSQHRHDPQVQHLYSVAFNQEDRFMEDLDSFYSGTLRLLAAGTLDPGDARRLLFKAKALRKWRLAPSSTATVRRQKALVGFLKRNEAAASSEYNVPFPYEGEMRKLLKAWLPDPRGSGWEWTGRFGPGAVAEHWTIAQKIEHLHAWCSEQGYRGEAWPEVPPTSSDVEHVASRLCAVPKQYSKDRLITVEPGYSSFAQQYVRECIQCSIHLGPLAGTCMDLGFTDGQKIQRRLALKASRTGKLATLDLSDASDNITWDAVLRVFPNWVTSLLDVSRTPNITVEENLPGYSRGERIPLHIFAGMGNGTTFTIETLFFAAFVKAYARCHGTPTMVSVFGDDIICSSEVASGLAQENFAFFRVNREKSFLGTDALRESCGIFAYKGEDITVPKVDGYSNDYCGRISLCDLERRLRASGIAFQVCLAHLIAAEGILVNWKRRYPGYPSIDAPECERSAAPLTRWNKYTCQVEARLPVVRQKTVSYPTDWTAAKRWNAPNPAQWYTYRLMSMFGSEGEPRSHFHMTSGKSCRPWSIELPLKGVRKTKVEWVTPLPNTQTPFLRPCDKQDGDWDESTHCFTGDGSVRDRKSVV